MKAKFGYQAVECKPTNGYRHLSLTIAEISQYNIGEAILRAIESGDEKRIARLERLAKYANGRAVYLKDSEVDITWQADAGCEYWYAPSISLTYQLDRPAFKSTIKAFEKLNPQMNSPRPSQVVEILGAIRLESIRDDKGEIVYCGGSIAYVENTEENISLCDPYPKAQAVA